MGVGLPWELGESCRCEGVAMRIRNISLRVVSLLVLTFVFVVATAVFTRLRHPHCKPRTWRTSLAEEARTFAREMDAVWEFMDNSQHTINNTTTGVYEFKGLHCAIVGKSVGAIFSAGNNYSIRYTNFEPRRAQDKPDAFETEALALFNEQKDTQEFFRIVSDDPAEVDRAQTSADNGAAQFRYVQALQGERELPGVPWRTGRGDRCHRLSQGGLDAGFRRGRHQHRHSAGTAVPGAARERRPRRGLLPASGHLHRHWWCSGS